MSSSDAQKSEVHGATGDASTSPNFVEDAETTKGAVDRKHPHGKEVVPDIRESDVKIVRDDTDNRGPLVVESNDPDLVNRDKRRPEPENSADGITDSTGDIARGKTSRQSKRGA